MDTKSLAAALAVGLGGLAAPALAQVVPPHPFGGAYPGVSVGEQHRYEMDRLRARSDQQDALARQQRLDTRLTLMELQARRQPAPDVTPYSAPITGPRSAEVQRAMREAVAIQSETTIRGVGQIDSWLDRAPRRTDP